MARYHTAKTATRRWPIAMFCNILDCASINAYILCCKVTKTQISRRDFSLVFIKEICMPEVHPVGVPEQTSEASQQQISNASRKRKQCQFSACKNKLFLTCEKCGKVCCGRHTVKKIGIVKRSSCIN